jgi:hypothetical protein
MKAGFVDIAERTMTTPFPLPSSSASHVPFQSVMVQSSAHELTLYLVIAPFECRNTRSVYPTDAIHAVVISCGETSRWIVQVQGHPAIRDGVGHTRRRPRSNTRGEEKSHHKKSYRC